MLGTESDQAHLTATEACCSSLIEPGSVYAFLAAHRRELFGHVHGSGVRDHRV